MGVDLGLQRLDVRLLGGLLLQIRPLKLPLKLRRHGVELVKQLFKFPVGGFLPDLIASLAAFHQLIRLSQHFHGTGDMAVKQGNGHERQRQYQQHHAADGPAHPRIFPENVVFFPVRREADDMSLGLGLIMYVPGLLRRLHQTAVCGDGEAVAVQTVLQIPDPVHRVQRKEQVSRLQQHHHAGIGGEGAVQKVSRHVHLPVDQQQADVRVRVFHFRHDLRGTFAALTQKAKAGGTVAEDIGAGIHVPEVDEHRLINFASGKALAQVVGDGAVQSGAVAVLQPGAVSVPHGAVVGYCLGIVDGVLEAHLHQPQSIRSAAVDLLLHGLPVVLIQQHTCQRHHNKNGHQPADQYGHQEARPKGRSRFFHGVPPALPVMLYHAGNEKKKRFYALSFLFRVGAGKSIPAPIHFHYFAAFSALRSALVLQKHSSSGTRRMQITAAVKPPLYRQNPPWRLGTEVTRK